MNARWQGYVEQREKYTRALEQRCSELEQTVSQHQQQEHHPHHQLTDELQRRVDQIILDHRQKAELAEDARLKVLYMYSTRYRRICAIGRSRCAVGLSLVSATINRSRRAINRLGRWHCK